MITERAHMRQKKKKNLTCHVEEDDAWILSYFVGSRASVEGMSHSFLNLQRAHDFLGKRVYFVNNHCLTDSYGSGEGEWGGIKRNYLPLGRDQRLS